MTENAWDVLQNSHGWLLRRRGGPHIISRHATKAAALARAKEVVRGSDGGGYVRVLDADGRLLSEWRYADGAPTDESGVS